MTIRDKIEGQLAEHGDEIKTALLALVQRYGQRAVFAAVEAIQRRSIGKIADAAVDDVADAFAARRRAELVNDGEQGDGQP